MSKPAEQLAIFVNVRKKSRRCPNKLLRPFAGTTLIDIFLEKIKDLDWPRIYFGAHEPEFLTRAERIPKLQVFRRSAASENADSDPKTIFEILHHIDTRWVCWINPCHVFLRMDTVAAAMQRFLAIDNPSMTAVTYKTGWFYDAQGSPLTNRGGQVDTALADGILEVAHSFHLYDRTFFLEHPMPWTNTPGDPALYRVSDREAIDIDTEEEFRYAEFLYQNKRVEETTV